MSWEKEKVEVKLQFPVSWGEDKPVVDKLMFRQMVAKDMKGFVFDTNGKVEYDQMSLLAEKICEHESGGAIINKLHPKDMFKVIEVVGDFLSGGQETGE